MSSVKFCRQNFKDKLKLIDQYMTQFKIPYSFYGSPPVTSIGSSEVKPFIHLIDLLSKVKVAIDNDVGTGFFRDDDVKNVLEKLRKSKSKSFKNEKLETAKQNLISAWIDEAALYESLSNDTLKFPGWSIIKFYYGIYHGISSITRTVDPNMDESNHNVKIKVLNDMFLNNKEMSKYLLPPLSATFDVRFKKYRFANPLTKNSSTHSDWIKNNLIGCLAFTYSKLRSPPPIISLFNMFKLFREYVNYYGTGATRFLYGTSVKENLKKSLPYINFYFQVMVENYLIANVGYSEIKGLWDNFKEAMTSNFGVEFNLQQTRFDTYTSFFTT